MSYANGLDPISENEIRKCVALINEKKKKAKEEEMRKYKESGCSSYKEFQILEAMKGIQERKVNSEAAGEKKEIPLAKNYFSGLFLGNGC